MSSHKEEAVATWINWQNKNLNNNTKVELLVRTNGLIQDETRLHSCFRSNGPRMLTDTLPLCCSLC